MNDFSICRAAMVLLGLQLVACESQSQHPSSEIQSQVGVNEIRFVDKSDQDLPHAAIGQVMPTQCTGFFVSQNFFVTNQHCVATGQAKLPEEGLAQFDASICQRLTINLKHYKDPELSGGDQGVFRCKKIHLANQAHDVAVIEIDGQFTGQPLQLGGAALPGMSVYTIGHPDADVKAVSEFNGQNFCLLRDLSFPDGYSARNAPQERHGPKYEHSIEHDCDTIGGSSGSPIIDRASGRVVAIHWDGWVSSSWPHADPNGVRQAVQYIKDPADHSQTVVVSYRFREANVGIRMQDIRAFVQGAAARDLGMAQVAALFR